MNGNFRIGEFLIEPEINSITRNGTSTRIEPKVMQVLVCLAEYPSKVVLKEKLIRSVWADTFVTDDVLTRSISELRKVFEDDAKEPRFIQTIPRSGYRLVAPISYDELRTERKDVPGPVASNRRKRFFWAAGILGGAFLLALVASYWSWYRKDSVLPTMKIVPFTTEGGDHDAAAFSPDGNQIAFSWSGEKNDNFDIYVKSIGGERPLRLTAAPGLDIGPTWSPDGQTIAFVRNWEKEWTIFTVPALGGSERKLLSLGPTFWDTRWPSLDWSSDGKFIASSYRGSKQDPAGILLFLPETGEKRPLTFAPAQSGGDFSPVFSPDSQTLAFVRHTSGGLGDLYLVPIAGGQPKRLTFDNAHIDRAAWTPDGREIIFSSSRLASPIAHGFLWRIPVVGGTAERLTAGGDRAFSVAVSSRGHRLAYTRWGGKLSIYRLELPASTGQPSVPVGFVSSTEGEFNSQFSPDGQRVAFESDRSGNEEIWTCNSDGSNPAQFTFLGAWAGTPRWSPDGRQIAFDSQAKGDWNIYTASADGGLPHCLTTEAADDNVPSWSRDGRWIYFASKRSGESQVWKVPSQGGAAVQLTRHGGFVAFESPDGKLVYYTKDGVNGIWQVPVEGGEETLVFESFNSSTWGNWAVVSDGIYSISSKAKDDVIIEFFSFATHRITKITKIAGLKREMLASVGLAVSPDRRSILFSQTEGFGSGSLMLVENFR